MTPPNGTRGQDHYAQLRRGTWFGALPPSLAKALFESGRAEEYGAGETIYAEESPAQGLFALVEGAVHFEKMDRSGHRVLLSRRRAGLLVRRDRSRRRASHHGRGPRLHPCPGLAGADPGGVAHPEFGTGAIQCAQHADGGALRRADRDGVRDAPSVGGGADRGPARADGRELQGGRLPRSGCRSCK